jgi:hypothetical protein
MNVVKARNANQALPEMMNMLLHGPGVTERESRNGKVLQLDDPTTIHYQRPCERVVFWPERDANPFFHLFESLWMLAGRRDVAYPAFFSSNIAQFSDDGKTFHGAYGYRWRVHFQMDQLKIISDTLRRKPEDRRQVLQMWDANSDLGFEKGKDLPCNLMAAFQRDASGALNMTVFNRSNDIVWGALGANCVHFSILQELMAASINCPVGEYWQVSANMHGYRKTVDPLLPLGAKAFPSQQYKTLDPYEGGGLTPYPLVSTPVDQWFQDLTMFVEVGSRAMGFRDPFFRRLAVPLLMSYEAFKDKSNPARFEKATNLCAQAAPSDWKVACMSWLMRREEKAKQK